MLARQAFLPLEPPRQLKVFLIINEIKSLWPFFFYIFLIVVLGSGIYKSFYNISNIFYFSAPHPLLSFMLPPLNSWNSFTDITFSIYTHVCTVFAPSSPPTPFPYFLPALTCVNPHTHTHPGTTCSGLLFSDFIKEKK
jgi:hypothetical protein